MRDTTDTASVPEVPGVDLLAALLDGMDAALCALDATGTITHWNREAERILGWSAREAVGRRGFDGWAARSADAEEILARLMCAMSAPGRQVHEFALLRKDGGRVLVRTQTTGVRGADERPAGVYCAFGETHVQIDLERSLALGEALLADAAWGVVLVDPDLRPAVLNGHAARAFGAPRATLLGRPLGDLVGQGVDELESALLHVLATGSAPEPADVWVTLRGPHGDRRRCWRCGFVRLASPFAEADDPVPLGAGWIFQDVTDARRAARDADRLTLRFARLHRACAAAAECEDPERAAAALLDTVLTGYADHVLVDRATSDGRLVRILASLSGTASPGPVATVSSGGIPTRYPAAHPALLALAHPAPAHAEAPGAATPRTSATPGTPASGTPAPGTSAADAPRWAADHRWPADTVRALCLPLRAGGRTLGVLTFLRSAFRPAFCREDTAYAETVAAQVAARLAAGTAPRADET